MIFPRSAKCWRPLPALFAGLCRQPRWMCRSCETRSTVGIFPKVSTSDCEYFLLPSESGMLLSACILLQAASICNVGPPFEGSRGPPLDSKTKSQHLVACRATMAGVAEGARSQARAVRNEERFFGDFKRDMNQHPLSRQVAAAQKIFTDWTCIPCWFSQVCSALGYLHGGRHSDGGVPRIDSHK